MMWTRAVGLCLGFMLLLSSASLGSSSSTDLPTCKRPAPPPAPAPPPPPPNPHPHPDPAGYKSKVVLTMGVNLFYTVNKHGSATTISFLLHLAAAVTKDVGWLGLGLSPTGTMRDGSFVVGYDSCVRVTSLSGSETDRPPNGKPGFAITNASFSRDEHGTWLAFERGLEDSLPGHVVIDGESTLHFLYAAGTTAPKAGLCTAELEMTNIHDIGKGSKAVPPGSLDLARQTHNTPVVFTQHGPERIVRTEVNPTTGQTYAVVEQSVYSSPMYLKNGEVVWTDIHSTIIPMPAGGDYAILKMRGEVVDCNNISVPLTTVYNHHWVMRPTNRDYNDRACPDETFSYIFGVGAESRDTFTSFPPSTGYIVKEGTEWGANIHLLHTEGLAGGQQGIKECIECWATPYRVEQGCRPGGNGTFECCGAARSFGACQVALPDLVPTEYYMKLYVTFTRELQGIMPLDIAVFRAPNCLYEYNVGDKPSVQIGDVNMVEDHWVIPQRDEAMFMVAHLHTGAINVTASVKRKGSLHFELICASYPMYGKNGTKPGNEAGHVVKVTYCLSSDGNDGGIPSELQGGFRNSSLVLEKGDTFRVQGYYSTAVEDLRIYPAPAGPHLGVMSFMYVAFKNDTSAQPDFMIVHD